MKSSGNTSVARLVSDEATARRVADLLSESLEAAESAIAAFEGAGGQWTVEVHFESPPDETALRALVGSVTGAALAFETIEAKDWVAASLADLKPVIAGRFTVHGAHDRAHVAPNRIGIEIEAALAFGTGHHGTTRGCLLALDRIVKERRRRPMRVLDVGTGTGVLAIAAAKALARRARERHRPEAVRIARENAHAQWLCGARARPARRRPVRRAISRARPVRSRLRQYPAWTADATCAPDAARAGARRAGRALRSARGPGERRACRLSAARLDARAAHSTRRVGDAGAGEARLTLTARGDADATVPEERQSTG